MEQLKFQIDEMINTLKQRSTGQSDLFEIIGKLEQVKSYLLVEAMRPIDPLPSGFFDDLPMDFQQPAPIDAPLLQQAVHVADGLQVADGVADGQQVDDDSRWMHSWDLSDEHHFVWMTPTPVPWFTTTLTKSIACQFLEIDTPYANDLLNGSPPKSFIRAPMFSSVGMPVTLTSSKLFGLDNITTCPGVLINIAKGIRYALSWPALGRRFLPPSTIHLSYQWKSFGKKHKLFISIESVSAQAGPSNQTVGSKRRNID
ncbi:hypothetical protein AABB24_038932 [Solanum stoloniferum]|uniref:Uncharacterized protein n=1 Tax=Solanum stoloniferum TaxID=62892 RepID=A0ABD2QZX6_9SOLN